MSFALKTFNSSSINHFSNEILFYCRSFFIAFFCFISPCCCCINPTELEIKAKILREKEKNSYDNYNLNDSTRENYYNKLNNFYEKELLSLDSKGVTCRKFSDYFVIFFVR